MRSIINRFNWKVLWYWWKLPILVVVLILAGWFIYGCGPLVKPGQIWIYTVNKGNPFEDPKLREYKVLEVREGWVKYQNVEDNFITTRTILYFKIDSHLKEETE